jgi:hypothetical protein
VGDVVDLKGQPAHLEDNHEFVADCCRYQEGILDEKAVRKKYGYSDDVWTSLGDNELLLAAIEEEKLRRIRNGQQKRERSQTLITKAPAILDSIACDVSASPRHRVDAIRTLDTFAANPSESAPASDRYIITINLNGDVERYDKSIAIDANDIGADNIGTAPPVLAAIAKRPKAKTKSKGDDDGDPV